LNNVVLIGMPGCVKTTIGRRAAAILGMGFLDLDECIVKSEGKTIPVIFQGSGETRFREIETRTLADIADPAGGPDAAAFVLSAGGGIVTRTENKALLKKIGRVIFIYRELCEIEASVAWDADRPLLKDPEALRRLWEERRSLYRSWADREFVNTAGEEKAAERLAKIIAG